MHPEENCNLQELVHEALQKGVSWEDARLQ